MRVSSLALRALLVLGFVASFAIASRPDAASPSDADTARVARSSQVRDFMDLVWPALSAPEVLARLWDDPAFLARCAPGLTEDERATLGRRAPRSIRSIRWTPADAVLLDELTGLIEGTGTFVHVVVDEAQDLSAMQCRAVARRCPTGSVTVLGDLAQATTPWAVGDWVRTLQFLGHGGARIRPLTAGYRVPGSVLQVANRLLPHIADGVPPATSIRAGSDALRFAARDQLVTEVARLLGQPGSLAVIVADAARDATAEQLRAAGIAVDVDEADGVERVSVVAAGVAKGLEFDSVLVVEPAAIVAAEATRTVGLRRLYVVLTRAVSHLTVLHDDPLPPELQRGEP
jgi:DNA helicase IV